MVMYFDPCLGGKKSLARYNSRGLNMKSHSNEQKGFRHKIRVRAGVANSDSQKGRAIQACINLNDGAKIGIDAKLMAVRASDSEDPARQPSPDYHMSPLDSTVISYNKKTTTDCRVDKLDTQDWETMHHRASVDEFLHPFKISKQGPIDENLVKVVKIENGGSAMGAQSEPVTTQKRPLIVSRRGWAMPMR